jgi:hypothetical protein
MPANRGIVPDLPGAGLQNVCNNGPDGLGRFGAVMSVPVLAAVSDQSPP